MQGSPHAAAPAASGSTPGASATPDASATRDAAVSPDAPVTPDAPYAPVTSDAPVAPDAPATPDIPAAPDAPASTDANAPSSEAPSEAEYGRSPNNANEQALTDLRQQYVDALNGNGPITLDLTPEARQELVDELLTANPPILSLDADGTLRMNESLTLTTANPDGCDPAEMDRQFSDANSVLATMSVGEWLERRVDFINQPKNYRSVSGSSKMQKAEEKRWFAARIAELMSGDSPLSAAEAAKVATAERVELNATHRLDMVAGGNPQDISGMGGRIENNKIGNIFKNEFVPRMEQHVLDLLRRVPPSLWSEVRMRITIGKVT